MPQQDNNTNNTVVVPSSDDYARQMLEIKDSFRQLGVIDLYEHFQLRYPEYRDAKAKQRFKSALIFRTQDKDVLDKLKELLESLK